MKRYIPEPDPSEEYFAENPDDVKLDLDENTPPEYLPVPPLPKTPEPKDVYRGMLVDEVIENDAEILNSQFRILHALWGRVTSISEATRLCSTTLKALAERRKLMLLPYGIDNKGVQDPTVQPLD